MNRIEPQKSGGNLPWLIFFTVVVLAACGYYSSIVYKNAYTVHPEKVFSENFTNPVSHTQNLIGGGEISSYYDYWIRFDCSEVVRFRKPEIFKKESPERASQWWSRRSDETGVSNFAELECWTMSEHPDPVKIMNGWLLYNNKLNRYWLRLWGRA